MSEPTITINGHVLTVGQAMAVRVAITDFYEAMSSKFALGDDDHGLKMTEAYRLRIREVLKMILPSGNR